MDLGIAACERSNLTDPLVAELVGCKTLNYSQMQYACFNNRKRSEFHQMKIYRFERRLGKSPSNESDLEVTYLT